MISLNPNAVPDFAELTMPTLERIKSYCAPTNTPPQEMSIFLHRSWIVFKTDMTGSAALTRLIVHSKKKRSLS